MEGPEDLNLGKLMRRITQEKSGVVIATDAERR